MTTSPVRERDRADRPASIAVHCPADGRTEPFWYPTRPRTSRIAARVVRLLGAHDWRRRLGRG